MEYTRSNLLTGSADANELATTKYQREQRKAIQFVEAENIVERFLENRLDPKFSETWHLDSYQVIEGVIPERFFLNLLSKLKTFQTDPLGQKQAIQRASVALVKENILEIKVKIGNIVEGREFKIIGAAHFYEPDGGEELTDMAIANLGG